MTTKWDGYRPIELSADAQERLHSQIDFIIRDEVGQMAYGPAVEMGFHAASQNFRLPRGRAVATEAIISLSLGEVERAVGEAGFAAHCVGSQKAERFGKRIATALAGVGMKQCCAKEPCPLWLKEWRSPCHIHRSCDMWHTRILLHGEQAE
jgi:hypothetical protein